MGRHFDFVAIGGGSAGFNAVRAAAAHGGNVALIDGAKELGGLCILKGCMPSKTLIHTADVMHQAQQAGELGLNVATGSPDMPSVIARKRRIIREFANFREQQLQSGAFELLRANARFSGPNELTLSDDSIITADRILIGTGSSIMWPNIPGLAESEAWTSDDILDLDWIPESILVLGGGPVACELSLYLARMGAKVIQIQRSAHILSSSSHEAAAVVEQALRDAGIELFVDTRLKRVSSSGDMFTVVFEHGQEEITRQAKHCMNGLGRKPATESLDLAAAGITCMASGHIVTNDFQQTSNPRVYAAGDCAGPHEIVHVAIQQAEVAVKHAYGRKVSPVDYESILQVTFTDPQLATVGPGKRELDAAAIDYVEASYPFDDHGKSILMEATRGYVRAFAESGSGRILSAEIVGKDASELIHVFAVAVSARLTVHDLLKAPWFHPTLSEIITYPLEEIAEKLAVI